LETSEGNPFGANVMLLGSIEERAEASKRGTVSARLSQAEKGKGREEREKRRRKERRSVDRKERIKNPNENGESKKPS
jgi:protein subunit release factor A